MSWDKTGPRQSVAGIIKYEANPQKVTDRIPTVVFSLVFYVLYTMLYGFAIMYIMEGWGLKLGR